jgi:transposase
MGVDSDLLSGKLILQNHSHWREPMPVDYRSRPTAVQINLGAIFISLELSRSLWLITSLSPGAGEKMSKHSVGAGDVAGLLMRLAQLQEKAQARTGQAFPIIAIQEAGLDGFWIHRVLESEGIESHVVDPTSIATSRRSRRAKTARIDGEALVRTLLAYKRGEPRVCAMVKAPTPTEEDRRRIGRERKTLTAERVQHVNRIKGLLFTQGIVDYEPLRQDRRTRLENLRTGDGRPLPWYLKAQINRELDRLELLLEQIKSVEAERDALLASTEKAATAQPTGLLLALKGIGPEFAAILWSEGLFRTFSNRRQVAAYAGLVPTPWKSGSIDREQGVSKAGNPRLRTTMVQLAWLWLRHQPGTALSRWFRERVERNGGRLKKPMIVALARKLLVALWKYVTAGVVIEGARITTT